MSIIFRWFQKYWFCFRIFQYNHLSLTETYREKRYSKFHFLDTFRRIYSEVVDGCFSICTALNIITPCIVCDLHKRGKHVAASHVPNAGLGVSVCHDDLQNRRTPRGTPGPRRTRVYVTLDRWLHVVYNWSRGIVKN